jgi:superfamily II DNA or RNA helicase
LGRVLRKSGNSRAVLYEVISGGTQEVQRSRRRRDSDAFETVRHRRM